jgi:pimeloyl-ACP methyl ester carboxylesterase
LVFSGGSANAVQLGYFNDFYARGDDVKNGNRARSSIKPAIPATLSNPELYTDWEEDGERLWDLRRALDYAMARPDVDPTRIIVVGLSLGGEMAALLGALDPRVTVTIAAGFSPDLSVLKFNGSHGCWNWHYADIREYLDSSELFALVAPRPLIIETGKQDMVYHCLPQPYAGDKQIARRARAAYFDAPDNFVHYLHSDYHVFRAGDANANFPERFVRVPLTLTPRFAGDQLWQTEGATWSPKSWTVFQYVASWMNYRSLM